MQSPRGTAFAALAALLAIGGVWPAHGAPRIVGPHQALVASGDSGGANGVCPAGTRAVSGGFDSPGFDDESSSTVRTSSRRAGKRGWRIDAAGFGDGSGLIVAHAYCERTRGKLSVRTASVPIPPNGVGGVTAVCRGRERAVSGGFSSPGFGIRGGSHVIALTSRRAGKRGWRAEAINPRFDQDSSPLAGSLVAYALCRVGGPQLAVRRETMAIVGETPRTVEAICPRGSRAVSGGFDGELAVSGQSFSSSGAIGSVRLPHAAGWRSTAISVAEGGSTQASVFAYCARRRR